MNVYIYLDDIRDDDYFYNHYMGTDWHPVICRDYGEACRAIDAHMQDNIFIDLDHDLGFDEDDGTELNGYDVCKYIIDRMAPVVGFHIHSMNPVGAANMRQLLTHYGIREV